MARKLFPKLSFESNRQYCDRLSLAPITFQAHVSNCIDQSRNQLFCSPFQVQYREREGMDPFWLDLQASASIDGQSLEHFARERFLQAQIDGRSYWLVCFPNLTDTPPLTALDWEQQDAGRAYLRPINCQDVTNWEVDDNGDLSWVILSFKQAHSPDPFSEQEIIKETFLVLDRQQIQTFAIEYPANKPPKEKDSPALVSTQSHGFQQVPLVCLDLQAEDLSIMPRSYQAQVHHWFLRTNLSLARARTCTPQQIIQSDALLDMGNDRDGQLRSELMNYALIVGSSDNVQFATPDGSSFESTLLDIQSVQEEIYRLCNFTGVAAREPKERARSGVAKEIDHTLTEVALRTYGVLVKASIERTLDLIAAQRGEPDLNFEVTGLDSFTMAIKGITVEEAQSLLALDMGETFPKEVKYLLSLKVLPGTSETVRQQIRSEIDALPVHAEPVSLEPQSSIAPLPNEDQASQSQPDLPAHRKA